MIDVGAIGQDYVFKGALVLVVVVRLDNHVLSKGEVRGGFRGLLSAQNALDSFLQLDVDDSRQST